MDFNNHKFTFTLKHEKDENIIFKNDVYIDTVPKDTVMSLFLNVLNDYKLNFKVISNTDKEFEVSFNEDIDYNIVIDLYRKSKYYSRNINNVNMITYRHLSNNENERLEQLKSLWKDNENNDYKYIYCISLVDGYIPSTFFNEKDMPCLIIAHNEPCYTWGNVYDDDGERVFRVTGSDVLLIEDVDKNGVIIDTQLELESEISISKSLEYILDDICIGLNTIPNFNKSL